MKRIVLVLFTLLLILTACKKKEVIEVPQEVIEEPIKEEPVVKTTTLIMGGDGITHESVYLDSKTDEGYDFAYSFEEIKKIVEPYDLAYYNQETVLGGKEYGVSGYPLFNSPKEVGEALIDAGFNLISLSSNHLLDFYTQKGNVLIKSQLDFFNKYPDVMTAGSYNSKEDRDKFNIKEVNGLTYTLLSYTYGSNNSGPNDDEDYLIDFIDKDLIKQDVKKYRDKVDLLIVAMHWGEDGGAEYSAKVTNYQKEYAKYLADLDVDIVIGNHPHVLQQIEWIDNTLVIYSLGNLFSNQYFNIDNLSSALVSLDIVKTTYEGNTTIELKNLKADMIFTVLEDRHKVYLYRDLQDEQLPNKDTYFEKYKSILKETCTDIEVK